MKQKKSSDKLSKMFLLKSDFVNRISDLNLQKLIFAISILKKEKSNKFNVLHELLHFGRNTNIFFAVSLR